MRKCLILLSLIGCISQLTAQELLIPYRIKDKWGYSDHTGKIKIRPRFQFVQEFNYDDSYGTVTVNDFYGLIDRSGRTVLPFLFRNVEVSGWKPGLLTPSVATGAIVTTQNDQAGLFQLPTGRLLVDTIYANISYLYDCLFLVINHNRKQGVFDSESGEWILQPVYEYASLRDDTAVAIDGDKEILIPILNHRAGKPIVQELRLPPLEATKIEISDWSPESQDALSKQKPAPQKADPYTSRLLKKDGLYGFRFDGRFEGDEVAPAYDSINRYGEYDGLLAVKKNGRWGLINSKSQQLLPFSYDEFDFYNSHISNYRLLVVRQGNKKMVIDMKGKPVTAGYDDIIAGRDHFFILKKDGLYGLLLLRHKPRPLLIEPKYYQISKDLKTFNINKEKTISLIWMYNPKGGGYISEAAQEYFKD